eukprot:3017479-Rhodomonas_salina.2
MDSCFLFMCQSALTEESDGLREKGEGLGQVDVGRSEGLVDDCAEQGGRCDQEGRRELLWPLSTKEGGVSVMASDG